MRQHLILALLLREKPKPNPGDNLNAPKSGLFYKRRPSHLHWRAKTLEIHHLAGHRALLSVAVSAVKTDTGWIYNLPLPTHTHRMHAVPVSHMLLVFMCTNTRNCWQWVFGERRKESAEVMLSVSSKVSKHMHGDFVLNRRLSGWWHLQNTVFLHISRAQSENYWWFFERRNLC